jgi:hypothetical protein
VPFPFSLPICLGLVVDYEVMPVYDGTSPFPKYIKMRAKAADPCSFMHAAPQCMDLNKWHPGNWIVAETNINNCS